MPAWSDSGLTERLWRYAWLKGPNCEAWLEEEDGECVHEHKGVDLIVEKALFVPHGAHKELLVFEDQRQHTDQDVDGTSTALAFLRRNLAEISCCFVHVGRCL